MTDPQPPEDQTEPETTEPRVIELNEWFNPFNGYDGIPYDNRAPDGLKSINFHLAHVGKFQVRLWGQNQMIDEISEQEKKAKYLIALPMSAKIILGGGLKSELDRIKTRIMSLDVDFDEELQGKSLPFNLEAKLPSGEIVSAQLKFFAEDLASLLSRPSEPPSTFDNWSVNGERIKKVLIPDVANIMERIQLRFAA